MYIVSHPILIFKRIFYYTLESCQYCFTYLKYPVVAATFPFLYWMVSEDCCRFHISIALCRATRKKR